MMKIGTRSLLFGVHQVFIHPWFVALAWWKLYGFPFDPRLWAAFIVHDWGYWGKPNTDGAEGERHVELGAAIMHRLFDRPCKLCDEAGLVANHGNQWQHFTLYHSRFYAKRDRQSPSRLCAADKLAIGLTPAWLYLPLARLSGELAEYMEGEAARTPAGTRSPRQWYGDVQRYCTAWAYEHRDGKADEWTGTKRDYANT